MVGGGDLAAFGAWRVEAINFNQGSKEMLAGPVRTHFEDRSVRIPDDEKFIGDLRMIQKETVGDKNRYVATDDDEADSHADRFWALALMLHAGKTTGHAGGYESIPSLRPENRRKGGGL